MTGVEHKAREMARKEYKNNPIAQMFGDTESMWVEKAWRDYVPAAERFMGKLATGEVKS